MKVISRHIPTKTLFNHDTIRWSNFTLLNESFPLIVLTLSARRVLNAVLLRNRKVLSLCKVYSICALLVLNRTLLNKQPEHPSGTPLTVSWLTIHSGGWGVVWVEWPTTPLGLEKEDCGTISNLKKQEKKEKKISKKIDKTNGMTSPRYLCNKHVYWMKYFIS